MKPFEECYNVFEGYSIDVWHDTTIGGHMRFRNTEFHANTPVTVETFIDTLKTNSLCYVVFNELNTINEYRKCVKRLHKLCPELFVGTLSYEDIINSSEHNTSNYGLTIHKGQIDEMIHLSDVRDRMHHVHDGRKAFSIELN